MKHLRNPSPRPGVVLDPAGFAISDPTTSTILGPQGPFGRERVLSALPLEPGPMPFAPPVCVNDGVAFLADPDGNLIGMPGLWIPRMLKATYAADTRRLG
jgi:hypothetical protein